jgi:hypothetical protein
MWYDGNRRWSGGLSRTVKMKVPAESKTVKRPQARRSRLAIDSRYTTRTVRWLPRRLTLLPPGERPHLRLSAVLTREQPLERGRIGARHVEYFLPASRPCHHRDRATADSERRSHQG